MPLKLKKNAGRRCYRYRVTSGGWFTDVYRGECDAGKINARQKLDAQVMGACYIKARYSPELRIAVVEYCLSRNLVYVKVSPAIGPLSGRRTAGGPCARVVRPCTYLLNALLIFGDVAVSGYRSYSVGHCSIRLRYMSLLPENNVRCCMLNFI